MNLVDKIKDNVNPIYKFVDNPTLKPGVNELGRSGTSTTGLIHGLCHSFNIVVPAPFFLAIPAFNVTYRIVDDIAAKKYIKEPSKNNENNIYSAKNKEDLQFILDQEKFAKQNDLTIAGKHLAGCAINYGVWFGVGYFAGNFMQSIMK